MNTLPTEIQEYHEQALHIAELNIELNRLSEQIVEKHCPYKVGDRVTYVEWWSKKNVKRGIIRRISFHGVEDNAIDNKWRIIVSPATKTFEIMQNRATDTLGRDKGDSIKLVESSSL